MKKIMFDHRRFGLEQAVLNRKKIMTRRAVRLPDRLTAELIYDPVMGIDQRGKVYFTVDSIAGKRDLYPQYQIGEELAVAQAYINVYKGRTVNGSFYDWCKARDLDPHEEIEKMEALKREQGWDNKMFVRADLMPHRIKITNIGLERMQDISDEDCRKEGIVQLRTTVADHETVSYIYKGIRLVDVLAFKEPRAAFRSLITKMMGKKVWDDNPWVWVYEFELVK